MINLNNYILEKLKIHSDIKLKRSHDVFNSKEDTFDFIKTACKEYGFSYEQNNYWLYIFKTKSSKFPNILFGYSDKDENGNILKNNHGLSTLKYNNGSAHTETPSTDTYVAEVNGGILYIKSIVYGTDNTVNTGFAEVTT